MPPDAGWRHATPRRGSPTAGELAEEERHSDGSNRRGRKQGNGWVIRTAPLFHSFLCSASGSPKPLAPPLAPTSPFRRCPSRGSTSRAHRALRTWNIPIHLGGDARTRLRCRACVLRAQPSKCSPSLPSGEKKQPPWGDECPGSPTSKIGDLACNLRRAARALTKLTRVLLGTFCKKRHERAAAEEGIEE